MEEPKEIKKDGLEPGSNSIKSETNSVGSNPKEDNKSTEIKDLNSKTDNITRIEPISSGVGMSRGGTNYKSVKGDAVAKKNVVYKTKDISERMGENISGLTKGLIRTGMSATSGTSDDAQLAYSFYDVASMSAVMTLQNTLHFSEKAKLDNMGVKNPQQAIININKQLISMGYPPVGTVGVTGRRLMLSARRTMIKAGGKDLPKEVRDLYKRASKIGANTQYLKRPHYLKRYGFRAVSTARRLALRNMGDVGQGINMTIMVASTAKLGVKASLKVSQITARISRWVAKRTLIAAMSAYLSRLQGGLGDAYRNAKSTISNIQSKRTQKKQSKLEDKLSGGKKERRKQRRREKRKRRRTNLKNKFNNTKLGKILANSRKRIARTKLFKGGSKVAGSLFKFFKGGAFIFRFLSGLLSDVANMTKTIILFVSIGAGFLLILYLILQILISSIAAIFGIDLEKDNTQKAIERLNELYNADLADVTALNSSYDVVEVEWKDIKDVEMYEKNKGSTGFDSEYKSFSQSTNCAEILSMAHVHFNYDINGADYDEVERYITQLYYGSHQTVIQSSEKSYVDAGGNNVYQSVATVIIKTNYFPSLFNCSLLEEKQLSTRDSSELLISSKDDIYVALRDEGYSFEATCGIMGNLQAESGFSATAGKVAGPYGIAQWMGGRLDKLKMDPNYDTMSCQLDYLITELSDNYSAIKDNIEDSDDLDYCTSMFCAGYEGCFVSDSNYPQMMTEDNYFEYGDYQYWQGLGKRKEYAKSISEEYKDYKDDWSTLINNGKKIAEYAASFAEKLHYVSLGVCTTGGTRHNYVGTRYLGSDLSTILTEDVGTSYGTDCSGFIYSVFKHFGIDVPTSTLAYSSKENFEIAIDDIQPGDVLWGDNNGSRHVEMYIGDGATMGLHDDYCQHGTNGCQKDSNINKNGLSYWKTHYSTYKVYRFWE